MLVPAVAQGIAGELADCRDACAAVIGTLLAQSPDLVAIVGAGARNQIHGTDATGTLATYGVDVTLGSSALAPTLPLALGIGRWLIDPLIGEIPLVCQEISSVASPGACAAFGDDLGRVAPRVALVAMGDGSGYPLQTPVGDDGRGGRYDDRVAAALESGDGASLMALDPAHDSALWVAGRPAWQALGGALEADHRGWRGTVRWRGAPYGVGYLVAELLPS